MLAPDRPGLWVPVEDVTACQPVGPLQHCSWNQEMPVPLLPHRVSLAHSRPQYVEAPLLVTETLFLAAHRHRPGILPSVL